ncbi:MAG: hypothetical protein HKO13_04095 [Sphingomonas sp.]|nr:hypothetical protein [Sphingomonas sp.]
MSRKRQRRKKAAPPPLSPQPGWLVGLRKLLIVEAAVMAIILLYLRITDRFEQGADAWVATIVMILVSTLALLVSYAASNKRRPRRVQIGWVAAGLVGGTALIAYLVTLVLGMGGETATLGIIVLPFYHWGLIALMFLGLAILDWTKK